MTPLSFSRALIAAILLTNTGGLGFTSPNGFTGKSSVPSRLNMVDPVDAIADPSASTGVIGAAIATLGAAGAAVLGFMKGGPDETVQEATPSEPEPEPIDVSIPYDAACLLAYEKWSEGKGGYNEAGYEAFKVIYESMTVADVTQRRYMREFQMLEQKLSSLSNGEN